MKAGKLLLAFIIFFAACQSDRNIEKADNIKNIDKPLLNFKSKTDTKFFVLIQIRAEDNLDVVKKIQSIDKELKISSFNGRSNDYKYVLIKEFITHNQSKKHIDKIMNLKLLESAELVSITQYNLRVLLSNIDEFSQYQKFYVEEIKGK